MKIVADENIPHVVESFSELGEVSTCAGRSMTPDIVRDTDVLLVRSVTDINQSLLEGSSVAYVGTATSGLDHIDQAYLAQHNIGFGHAQGANANSVAEYVVTAVIEATSIRDKRADESICGIIGYGHVGAAVYEKLRALGFDCIAYDPPLAESRDGFFSDWEDILACDIITFHTPFTRSLPYPTYHIADDKFLGCIKSDAILINAARGELMDTQALIQAKRVNPDMFYAFDVWENEPSINRELLGLTDIATPHIAGYSWDAKIAGTRHVFDGVCDFYSLRKEWTPPTSPRYPVDLETNLALRDTIQSVLRYAYPIHDDDKNLRGALKENSGFQGLAFDSLRKNYWIRREFSAYQIKLNNEHTDLIAQCKALGFQMVE